MPVPVQVLGAWQASSFWTMPPPAVVSWSLTWGNVLHNPVCAVWKVLLGPRMKEMDTQAR